jgi:hypothetical protein
MRAAWRLDLDLPDKAVKVLWQRQEKPMSKHDTPTKPHRRPKSAKRVDYTARTMAALKQLAHEAKLRESQSPLPKTL